MRRIQLWKVGTALAAALGIALAPSVAFADGTSSTGYDVSYPQCSKAMFGLPGDFAFGIVGLNKGLPTNANSCFSVEQSFVTANHNAAVTEQPRVAYYVNAANPSVAGAWWPTSNTTQAGTSVENPNGTCAHKAGSACAYIYGYSMAEQDVHPTIPAIRAAGTPSLPATGASVWLDVETTNTWQSSKSDNGADLAGMTVYLQAQDATVGLYSTTYQWGKIVGSSAPSVLKPLTSWLAGAGSASGAASDCDNTALVSGRVSMVQYEQSKLDHDFSCHVFSAPTPTISGTAKVGKKLTAHAGTWSGAAKLTYQWTRNGAKISGATKSTHTTKSSDSGKTLRVVVTGKASGYNTAKATSAGFAIAKK